MTNQAIPKIEYSTLAVNGSGARFPVRRVYCVGRNYAEHSKEMGGSGKEVPFFFAKPADAILNVADGSVGEMPYPSVTQNLHHEIELVLVLSSGGKNLTVEQAADCIWGYAIGLDMTRRDLQAEAKKAGRPWEVSKAFDYSAPISEVKPIASVGNLDNGNISLKVNGELRQQGDLSDMIWQPAEALSYLSTLFELKAGDLLFTGTPAGVGAVQVGDSLTAEIDGLGKLELKIV